MASRQVLYFPGRAAGASIPAWPALTRVPDAVSWQRRIAPQRRAGVPAQRNPGWPDAGQFDGTAAFAPGRPARSPVTSSHHDRLLARRMVRTVVDGALGRHRCAGPLGLGAMGVDPLREALARI
jgi:hypothetical protein